MKQSNVDENISRQLNNKYENNPRVQSQVKDSQLQI